MQAEPSRPDNSPYVLSLGGLEPPKGGLTLEYLADQVSRLNLAVYGYPENNVQGLLKFRELVELHMRQMNRLQWWFAGLTVGLGVNTVLALATIFDQVPLP